nr:hypothetical protein [Tanacetum cinerariifolium]
MHNNIMAAGSRDRPPMLARGRYAHWRSRFLRYIDTRPNGDAFRKCILKGPYTLSTVIVPAVPVTENSPAFPEHTTLRKCGKLSKGYNKVNHSTFKMSRKTYFGSLENSPLTMEKQWNLITQGKEIAKPITPPSESALEEDSDPKQAQRDKDMQKNLALIAKYFKKIYKPTNNNLRISSNSRNKNVDTTPRYKNDNQSAQFGNQRTMAVTRARENVGSLVQYDARYNVFANEIQHSEQSESIRNTCVVETNDSDVIPDSPDMCDNDIQNDQNAVECDDERVALANLIANLKIDVDENKKIQKQLKKASISLTQELTECKSILAETSRTLGSLIGFGIVS